MTVGDNMFGAHFYLARTLIPAIALFAAACGPAEPGATSSDSSFKSASAVATTSGVAPSLDGAAPRAATSASAASSSLPVPPGPVRYVVAAMGDSLTDPKSHGGKYLDVLRERCPKSTFMSFGKGGNMVNMMRKRFLRDVYGEDESGAKLKDVERPAFTHVIILGGLGDILSNETAGRTAKKIGEDIMKMVGFAHAHNAKAYVLSLPPWGAMKAYDGARAKMTADVNAWIADAFEKKEIDGTFDTRPHLICGNPEVLCKESSWADGIHWSAEGHRKVGEALHAALFSDCE